MPEATETKIEGQTEATSSTTGKSENDTEASEETKETPKTTADLEIQKLQAAKLLSKDEEDKSDEGHSEDTELQKRHKAEVKANYEAMLADRETRFAKLSELAIQVPGVRVERMEKKNTEAPEPPMVPGIDLFVEDFAIEEWLKITEGVEGIGDMDFLRGETTAKEHEEELAETTS
jgi:hypothetical protein